MTTIAAALPPDTERLLVESVGNKFAAYLAFTPGAKCTRVVDIPGQSFIVYPNDSMVSDLTVFWSLFVEVYETLRRGASQKFAVIAANPVLAATLWQIIDDDGTGEYWTSTAGSLVQERGRGATELAGFARTLRNGYGHFHWHYSDLSAVDYWRRSGWDTQNAAPQFRLSARMAGGHIAYIADSAPRLDGPNFWGGKDLRIIVAKYILVRWYLYRFLRHLLDGVDDNLFDH
jgi:hypothetical protein